MKIINRRVQQLALLTLLNIAFISSAESAIFLSNASGFARVNLSNPISFEVTASVPENSFFGLIGEDFFVADTDLASGNAFGNLPISVAANTVDPAISTSSPTANLYDRNDLLISFFKVSSDLNIGGTVTFGPGFFDTDIPFNSLPATNLTTSLTVVNGSWQGISGSQTVSVPEPAGSIFLGLGAILLAFSKRGTIQLGDAEG